MTALRAGQTYALANGRKVVAVTLGDHSTVGLPFTVKCKRRGCRRRKHGYLTEGAGGGAFYDKHGNYLADLRNSEYNCPDHPGRAVKRRVRIKKVRQETYAGHGPTYEHYVIVDAVTGRILERGRKFTFANIAADFAYFEGFEVVGKYGEEAKARRAEYALMQAKIWGELTT